MTALKPYAEYKDSGVEWLGEIPGDWTVVPLRYVADVETGSKDTVNAEHDGKYPFFVRSPEVLSIGTYSYDCEAILTPGDGDVGKIFHHFVGKFDVHQRVYVLLNFRRIEGKFLYRYFASQFGQVVFYGGAKSTVASLRRPMFTSFPVLLPSEEAQRAIASFLDHETAEIDAFIADQQELIGLLNERRAATITQAVAKGLDPTVAMKDSGVEWLGDVPATWVVRPLKYMTRISRGLFQHRPRNAPHLYGGPHPFIQTGTIAQANGGEILEASQYLSDAGLETSKKFPSGTLVMAIAANIGDIAILRLDSCAPDSVLGFTPGPDVDSRFLLYSVMSARSELQRMAPVSTQGNLNIERVGSLIVTSPPLISQQEIADYLDRETAEIDAAITDAKEAIELSKERRAALISAAATGKIDVRDHPAAKGAA